jgi:hypothetical protein
MQQLFVFYDPAKSPKPQIAPLSFSAQTWLPGEAVLISDSFWEMIQSHSLLKALVDDGALRPIMPQKNKPAGDIASYSPSAAAAIISGTYELATLRAWETQQHSHLATPLYDQIAELERLQLPESFGTRTGQSKSVWSGRISDHLYCRRCGIPTIDPFLARR